jgi:hypothetical protein
MFFSREPAVPMIMSIYITLGIFLLLAVRDPAANRSLIAFGGWANLAHAGVMAVQEYRNVIERRELAGVVVFAIVGVVLVASRWLPRSNQSRRHRRPLPRFPDTLAETFQHRMKCRARLTSTGLHTNSTPAKYRTYSSGAVDSRDKVARQHRSTGKMNSNV